MRNLLLRCWRWFTMPCSHCGMRLYFGPRVQSLHGVYCGPRCYQIGLVIVESARRRGGSHG